MDLHKTYITRLLSAVALLLTSVLFVACFDIPSKPSTKNTLKGVTVQIQQGDLTDTLLLKIHPSDSATLSVIVNPKKFADDLDYSWYHKNNNESLFILGKGETFPIPAKTSESQIPNALVVTDEEGNSILTEFEVVVNTPPKLSHNTYPANGDTLYGGVTKSFLFKWQSSDSDNENLIHSIVIDTVRYDLGELTSIYQSGFAEGEHTFQVFVSDEYGDKDSTSVISFYVKQTEKDEK